MKITVFIAFFLILAICLYGCARAEISAEEVLYSVCAELELPSGETYLSFADEGSRGYFSAEKMREIYGKEAEKVFSLTSEYAVFFSSFAYPYEVAVLKCRSRSDTYAAAALLSRRADEVSIALRDTEFSDAADKGITVIKGRFVIFIRSDDHEGAKKILSDILP